MSDDFLAIARLCAARVTLRKAIDKPNSSAHLASAVAVTLMDVLDDFIADRTRRLNSEDQGIVAEAMREFKP